MTSPANCISHYHRRLALASKGITTTEAAATIIMLPLHGMTGRVKQALEY
jgi:hypothetical protein